MKTILITGGTGFIGSHVGLECAQRGYRVILVDVRPPAVFDPLSWSPNVRYEQCDLLDESRFTGIVKQFSPDVIVHMAAKIEVEESQREPGLYYANNVNATRIMLDAMRVAGCKRLVFSSTAAVYGNVDINGPIPESYADSTRPASVYGRTKRHCEDMIQDYASAFGMSAIVFRYFNAAGASPKYNMGENREHETHLIPVVMERLLHGQQVSLFGVNYPTVDGTCVRDYIHVFDLARAHRMGIDKLLEDPHLTFKVMNLGSSEGLSVKQVVNECIRVSGVSNPDIKICGPRAGDVATLVADSSEAARTLGWKCEKNLNDIVQDTWDWQCFLKDWRLKNVSP
jgi:UDP-glucose-4-epimerase GalE